ncbi:MAG: L-alanine exporter AlaE [Candidatus Komeilibacteria bacterium]
MLAWLRSRLLRLWTAAFAASLAYNIPTGALNYFLERWLAHVTKEQWALVHWGLFPWLRYPFAFIGAYLTWKFRRRLRAHKHTLKCYLSDALALACYQIPIYLTVCLIGGRRGVQLAILLGLALAEHLLLGPFHGMLLDFFRAKFANNGRKKVPRPAEPAV